MSTSRQESYIQLERRRREAYERHRQQLREVSEGLLAELSEALAKEKRLRHLSELLNEPRRQHEHILAGFTYEAFVGDMRGWYPQGIRSYRESIWQAYYREPHALTEACLRALQESLRAVWCFLERLRQSSLEREEEVQRLLELVPSGAPLLEQELRERHENLRAARLREEIRGVLGDITALNAEVAQRLQDELGRLASAGRAAPLERFLEQVKTLRRTIEARRGRILPLLDRLQSEDASAAEQFAAQLASVEGVREEGPFQKLYEAVLNHLLRLSRLKAEEARRQSQLAQETALAEEEHRLFQERGRLYYEKLLDLNPTEAHQAAGLYQELLETQDIHRARLLKDELQLRYLRALEAHEQREVLKSELAAAYRSMPIEALQEELQSLLADPNLDAARAEAFVKRLWAHAIRRQAPSAEELEREEAEIMATVMEGLRRHGYETLSEEAQEKLRQGEMVELKTPFGPDYAVRLRFQEGLINARLVRYVEDASRLSEYEKLRDKMRGQTWCQDWEKVLSALREKGLQTETRHREEEKFYYVSRPASVKTSASQTARAPQAQQRKQKGPSS
jgi:hypothetical protein